MSVLSEAEALINGDRGKDYGHPKDNFGRIVSLWQSYLDGRAGGRMASLTTEDHAIMMILVKIARLQENPRHWDSAVDVAGYVGTLEKLWEAL